MCSIPPSPRLASAYVVYFGCYGDVTRLAAERGVCRQWIYREAAWVVAALPTPATPTAEERQRLGEQEQHLQELQRRLDRAVVLDQDKLAEFACVGQARGVSLPDLQGLLDVLLPGRAPSVATLGRWSQAAAAHAAPLLAALDVWTRPHVRQALADEIYVSQPVLMVVEPESLCWLAGRRLTEPVTGAAWTEELGRLEALEQVTRDGGNCLGRGVADLNRERQRQGRAAVADQLDHYHLLREGARGVGGAERVARGAFNILEKAEAALATRARHGPPRAAAASHYRACLRRAERALDVWAQRERAWQDLKAALQPFTADGELNTRAQAEAQLARVLPQLPEATFASLKRQLQRPEALTYLDEIQRKLRALPLAAAVQQAALRQEGLRRRPELLQGETPAAAARRGVLLVCAVVLARAGAAGQQAVAAVRALVRGSWRASSLVECVNSVVRMQQARHRKLSQGLLDLKRLYWNCHVFRTGRRRGQSPYQRLGLPWPKTLRWWELLKWSPERLHQELSTLKPAG